MANMSHYRCCFLLRRFSRAAISFGFASTLSLSGQASAQAVPDLELLRGDASRIILVGDSTVAVGSGWGGAFCSEQITYRLACLDLARNGRSTASYRREGSWQRVIAEARSANYDRTWILIQFGHNDQPGKPGHSTDLEHEYPRNLERYISEARAAGAIPILVTPLTRRIFRNGHVDNSLAPWAEAIRAVGTKLGVPVIDLNRKSVDLVQSLGPVLANRLAQTPPSWPIAAAAAEGQTPLPAATKPSSERIVSREAGLMPLASPRTEFDYTHLGSEGAHLFAAIVAQELASSIPELRPYLVIR